MTGEEDFGSPWVLELSDALELGARVHYKGTLFCHYTYVYITRVHYKGIKLRLNGMYLTKMLKRVVPVYRRSATTGR